MDTPQDHNGFEIDSINNQANIEGNVTPGNGDLIGRDKYIGGDVVSGDKILGNKIEITNHYRGVSNESSKAKWIPSEITWPDGSTMVMLPIYTHDSNALFISKHPITNKQYRAFVQDTNAQEPHGEHYDRKSLGWREPFYPWQDHEFSDDSLPVVCVSYQDSKDYCDWVKKLCLKDDKKFIKKSIILLPWIKIWEFAAFGTSSPTLKSDVWLKQTNRIHHKSTVPAPIDTNGIRINNLGISDLFGNIWEWCSTRDKTEWDIVKISGVMTGKNSSGVPISIPYEGITIAQSSIASGKDNKPRVKNELNVELRGGSFLDDLAFIRPFETASRLDDKENTRHFDLGFRICAKAPLSTLDEKTVKYLSDNALETWN